MNDQPVRLEIGDLGVSKQYEGGPSKLNGNLCRAARKALSRTQVERHSGPAPVIDLELQCNIGFGVRCWRDPGFVAISQQSFASGRPLAVLSADRSGGYVLGIGNLNGMQNFRLLVADRVGIERDWRLHPRQRHQLKEMIGHLFPPSPARLLASATP